MMLPLRVVHARHRGAVAQSIRGLKESMESNTDPLNFVTIEGLLAYGEHEEEPNDPMLAELHTMRACMAIKAGRLTLEEALGEIPALAA